MDDLVRELDSLVADGVITREQAETIRRRMVARGRPAGRISLGTEALGYLGAVLVLASGATFLGLNWKDIAVAGRLGITVGVAA
ncbi:MAG: DUF2157 domain-containing protein, partial [Actinobacteria bacterium]|nr:DUF2157 domain-containing protein [Actinomycetota bacterium]